MKSTTVPLCFALAATVAGCKGSTVDSPCPQGRIGISKAYFLGERPPEPTHE